MTKDMTIDELALATAQQFAKVDEQFKEVGHRFDRLEAGQSRLEQGLQRVLDVVLELPTKKAFEKLEKRVGDIDDRVTILERKLTPTSA